MGGRGTFAFGNMVAYTYQTTGTISGIKVLSGLNGKHGLPEEAHSSYAYIKLKPDGTFHEMRIYDKDHFLKFELAYHPEPNLIRLANRFFTTMNTLVTLGALMLKKQQKR